MLGAKGPQALKLGTHLVWQTSQTALARAISLCDCCTTSMRISSNSAEKIRVLYRRKQSFQLRFRHFAMAHHSVVLMKLTKSVRASSLSFLGAMEAVAPAVLRLSTHGCRVSWYAACARTWPLQPKSRAADGPEVVQRHELLPAPKQLNGSDLLSLLAPRPISRSIYTQ